jgi:hypothetical protein
MSTTKIGIQVPDDLDREAGPAYSGYRSDTGMEYELFECVDGIGALIGSSHEDVGLVTWWRTDSLAEGTEWIDDKLVDDEAEQAFAIDGVVVAQTRKVELL